MSDVKPLSTTDIASRLVDRALEWSRNPGPVNLHAEIQQALDAERERAEKAEAALKESREAWENARNACIRAERERERDGLAAALAILKDVAEYGPQHGTKQEGIACAFCDMGGAGYSSRGDGYHDDNCAVQSAQRFLKDPSQSLAALEARIRAKTFRDAADICQENEPLKNALLNAASHLEAGEGE